MVSTTVSREYDSVPTMILTMHCFVCNGRIVGPVGQKAKVAQADKEHAEGQEAAGQRVLIWNINEKNKLLGIVTEF